MLKNSIQIVGDKGIEPINLSVKDSRVIPITPIPRFIFINYCVAGGGLEPPRLAHEFMRLA